MHRIGLGLVMDCPGRIASGKFLAMPPVPFANVQYNELSEFGL